MNLDDLLERGYFPKEIPPCFWSAEFAAVASLLTAPPPPKKDRWTAPVILNLARPGTLRRRLSIPNPFSQRELASLCAANFSSIEAHLQMSSLSLSRPVPSPTGRALEFYVPFSGRAGERVQRLGYGRYTLRADISACYGSIYTHAIEWALHSKKAAKLRLAHGGAKPLGALLDDAVREGQEGQTKGIPVGPDTSLLLAEILLTEVDLRLESKFPRTSLAALRFVDDLEFYAQSRAEAEDVLFAWDNALGALDLSINAHKTTIIEGAAPPAASWQISLSQFELRRSSDAALRNDLQSMFSLALSIAAQNPGDPVLSYAINRVHPKPTGALSWPAFMHLLLGAITTDPSCLRFAVPIFQWALVNKLPIDVDKTTAVLDGMCAFHAPLEHGSEVAWSLYLLRVLSAKLTSKTAALVALMQDNCSLLLLLDMDDVGLVEAPTPSLSDVVARAEDPLSLRSEDWLLAYECARNSWCSPAVVTGQPQWKEIFDLGVRFFRRPKGVADDSSEEDPELADQPETDIPSIADFYFS